MKAISMDTIAAHLAPLMERYFDEYEKLHTATDEFTREHFRFHMMATGARIDAIISLTGHGDEVRDNVHAIVKAVRRKKATGSYWACFAVADMLEKLDEPRVADNKHWKQVRLNQAIRRNKAKRNAA